MSQGPRIPGQLLETLQTEGYRISEAIAIPRPALGVEAAAADAILIHDPGPGQGAISPDLCRWLRASGVTTPILVLSDGGGAQQRIAFLDAGADDCLASPMLPAELLARLRAQRRRSGHAPSGASPPGNHGQTETLHLEDLSLNQATRTVTRGGKEVKLTVREYDLLLCLFQGIGRVLSRDEIVHTVWGEHHFGDDNLLDVYIRYLRRKLEPPGLPTLIQTIRGVGFTLKPGELRPNTHHHASRPGKRAVTPRTP